MKKDYPERPWRTFDDPIAGHARTYEHNPQYDWYTEPSPAKSYRSIFKWANPKEYKIPSEGMYDYLKEKLDFDEKFLRDNKNFGLEEVKYERACALTDEEVETLLTFVGGNGSKDNYDRLFVAYGKTLIDIMRLREKKIDKVPDLVLYPAETDEIEKIVKFCNEKKIAIYVYSGGSSVTFGVEPMVDRCITLDLGKRFNKIIDFNYENQTVTVQPGIFGTALEEYLNNPDNFKTHHAYTCGHFPQSFERSTVGGWVVTRGAGQNSAYYGKIEDIVLCQQYVTPVGTFRTERAPRKATGPDIDQIMIGGEGAYGILTEVTLKCCKLSHTHKKFAFFFKNWEDGMNCMRDVMQAEEGIPSIFRISDAEETDLAMNMYGFKGTVLETFLKAKGYVFGEMTFMVGFCDGAEAYQKMTLKTVKKYAEQYGAIDLGKYFLANYIVDKWSAGRFSDPYLRDNWQDYGVIIDTLECAVNWDNMDKVHDYVRGFIKSYPNVVCTCHISHPYPQGANLYFIWMQKYQGLEQFRTFHSGVLQSILESGASISHHHGIGKLFAKYNAESLGETQMEILRALKKHFDPNDIMNPGGTLYL